MGVIGEAAGRDGARRLLVTEGHHDECWTDGSRWHCQPGCSAGFELRFEPLASRRDAGDADPHETALRRVEDARVALRENLRAGYALDEGQIATVLRVVDALAAGASPGARETLGREVTSYMDSPVSAPEALGERLFAIGRASVAPVDPDLARIIASWPVLAPLDRDVVLRRVQRSVEWHWRTVAERALSAADAEPAELAWLTLYWKADRVVGCDVEGKPATVEQWAKLHAAGVPVADGVGV